MIIKPILECKGVQISLDMDEIKREADNPAILQAELRTVRDKYEKIGWDNLQAKVVKAQKAEPRPFCDRKFSNKQGVNMHIVQMRRHGHEDHGSDDGHEGWE